MAGWKKHSLSRGQLTLSAQESTSLEIAEQYYKIDGVFSNGNALGFYVDSNKLIYTGCDGCCFLFNGSSDLKSNKVGRVTYSLYINGVLVVGAETPTDFKSANSVKNINITAIITLQKFDKIEIYAKSDTANTTINVSTLRISLLGAK